MSMTIEEMRERRQELYGTTEASAETSDIEDYLTEKLWRQNTLIRKLPFSLTFFAVYAAAVLDHEHTADSFSLQYELRGKIEGTVFNGIDFTSGHKTMYELDNEGDFYMYLKEAFIPFFIHPLDTPPEERYRVLRYNQIIGGVQLQQVRRESKECSSEYPDLGPFPEAGRTNPILADFECFPWYTESAECFGPGLEEQAAGFCPDSMGPPPQANPDGTEGRRLKAGRRLEYVPDASGDGSGMKGARSGQEVYSIYLYEHEGQDKAFEKIDALEEQGWIDLNTAWVGGKLLVFNPTLAIFVHCTIHVYFPPSGALQSFFTAQSFVSEPYQKGSTLALDILFLLLLLWSTLELLRKIQTATKEEKVIKLAVNAYTWLHVFLVVGGFLIVIFWLALLDEIVAGKNRVLDVRAAQPDVQFTSDTYPELVVALHEQMTIISDFLANFRMWLGVYMLLVACTTLEAFASQPRLALLTETLIMAGADLAHFFVVMGIVFIAYTVSGMFLFGRRIWEFSTFTNAIPFCFLMLFGDFDWDALKAEHPMVAGLWFWSYAVLAVLVLLNMLMAIVMDKYAAVKAETLDSPAVWEQAEEMMMDSLGSKLGISLSMGQILARVQEMNGKVDKDTLRANISGLTKVQAEELLEHSLLRLEMIASKGMTISKAMRQIGWVHIHVHKLNWSLETLLKEEEEQLKIMTFQQEDKADEVEGEPPPDGEDEDDAGDGVGGALVADVGQELEDLELRMMRLENFMGEAVNFAAGRGADIANRIQVIEHLLRGQRDAAMTSSSNVWDEGPPKFSDYQDDIAI